METNWQFFKSISIYLLLTFFVVSYSLYRIHGGNVNTNSGDSIVKSQLVLTNNTIVNLDNADAIKNYLTSKTFKNANGGLSVKFYPEGYYDLKKNFQLAMTGGWTIGGNTGKSVMIHLVSDEGNLDMILSSDGTLTDTASSRIFQ